MLSKDEILQTIHMIDQQHLDIRTITMGISLLSCADPDAKVCLPEHLRQDLHARPSIWCPPARPSSGSSAFPSSTSASPSPPSPWWRRAREHRGLCPLRRWRWIGRLTRLGVNFIGGYSALVQKGMTESDRQAHPLHSRSAGHH